MILDKSFKPLQVCFLIDDVHSLTGISQLFICIYVPPMLLDTERIMRDMAFMCQWETHEIKTDILPSRCESSLRRQISRVTARPFRSEVREGRPCCKQRSEGRQVSGPAENYRQSIQVPAPEARVSLMCLGMKLCLELSEQWEGKWKENWSEMMRTFVSHRKAFVFDFE